MCCVADPALGGIKPPLQRVIAPSSLPLRAGSPAPPRPERGFDSRSNPTRPHCGGDRGCHNEWRAGLRRLRSRSSQTGRPAGAARNTAIAQLSSSVVAAVVACARCARCWVRTAATQWAWPKRRLRACRWGATGACTAGLGGWRLSTGVRPREGQPRGLRQIPLRPGNPRGPEVP